MHRLLLALVTLFACAAPASAAQRSYVISNFDRIRVDGAFEVRVAVGAGSATARVEGEDDAINGVDVSVQGNTLIVRRNLSGWGEQPKPEAGPTIVWLATPALHAATVIGGGKLSITGKLQSPRFDFTVTGTGAIDAKGIQADDTIATVIGSGSIALAGRSARARLLSNGNGTIAAGSLDVGDLLVRLDGPGQTQASARYTADITNSGLGAITVAGNPKCRTASPAGGPVTCGGTAQ